MMVQILAISLIVFPVVLKVAVQRAHRQLFVF